jgi:hypothetical protein
VDDKLKRKRIRLVLIKVITRHMARETGEIPENLKEDSR